VNACVPGDELIGPDERGATGDEKEEATGEGDDAVLPS
jgi:hypothetical protein